MAIFIICRVTSPELMGPAIAQKFPDNYKQLDSDQWLVSAKGTAKEISDKIGITGKDIPQVGSAIVLTTTGYFGRAPSEIWEWVKAKTEAT